MPNAIRFLELMGQNANLRYSTKSSLYDTMNAQQIDSEAQWAILRGDQIGLASLVGVRGKLVCMVAVPEVDVAEEVIESAKQAVAA